MSETKEVAGLVERLKRLVILDEAGSDNPLGRDAAREIERLTAERDAAREALKPFALAVFNDNGDVTIETSHITTRDYMRARAIRSLKQGERE